MTLQCLDELAFFDIPELYGRISATRNEVGRVTGKLAIPNPFKVTFEDFVLEELEPVVVRYDFEEFDFFICRTGGKELIVR